VQDFVWPWAWLSGWVWPVDRLRGLVATITTVLALGLALGLGLVLIPALTLALTPAFSPALIPNSCTSPNQRAGAFSLPQAPYRELLARNQCGAGLRAIGLHAGSHVGSHVSLQAGPYTQQSVSVLLCSKAGTGGEVFPLFFSRLCSRRSGDESSRSTSPPTSPIIRRNFLMITIANVRTTTAVLPPRVIIHGREGSGKTTLAEKFPGLIFLQTEDGAPAGLQIATFGLLAKYDDIISAIAALGNEHHEYQTIVIDSLDVLESLIWDATCAIHNWRSIESPSFGKGYVECDKQWLDLLAGLDWLRRIRRMMVVLLAHSSVETVNDPRAQSYTSYQLRLHKRGRGLVQDWCDAIGFLSTELVIHTEDQGFRKRTRADGGSARYLHWEGRPAFTAKNRYNLPAKMPVAKDFDFAKQLAPYFPPSASQHSANQQPNGGSAAAGDGADRDADRDVRIELTETSATGG
jgi:hypothetical protein